MFERLRNRFFRQDRDAISPAQEEQRGAATALSADPAQAPAPEAERSQAGQAAAAPAVAAAIGPTEPESAAAVAQPPAKQQAASQAADPDLHKQQALAPGLSPLSHPPSPPAANRPVGPGRAAVITIDNRRYHYASLPEDVRQLVLNLQAADRVIAQRRELHRLLLVSRRSLTAQLRQGLQKWASLPPEAS